MEGGLSGDGRCNGGIVASRGSRVESRAGGRTQVSCFACASSELRTKQEKRKNSDEKRDAMQRNQCTLM